MPKPSSTFGPQRKSGRPKQHPLENADEFLAAGVDNEEAGEKWRAGDAAKSYRFFARAIETYDQGLRQFPNSFDLNYNKARVQYQITQYPALLSHYPAGIIALLNTALESHRQALKLDQTNADVLFNTAQVLISLAETAIESEVPLPAAPLLEEAISLFQKCLEFQEVSFEQRQADPIFGGGVSLQDQGTPQSEEIDRSSSEHEAQEESWASIVEPVTEDTLLETVIGVLDAIASLSEIHGNERTMSLNDLESLARMLIESKIQPYIERSDQEVREDVFLAIVKVKAALLDAKFNADEIDVRNYDSQLQDAFSTVENVSLKTKKPAALLLYAEALITFAESVRSSPDTAILQWTRLNTALNSLKEASHTQDPGNSVIVNLTRGDVELLRFALSCTHGFPESLSSSQVKSTLLKNAEVYYRGAASLLQQSSLPNNAGQLLTAKVKEATAASIREGGNEPLKRLLKDGVEQVDIERVLSGMVEELVVDKEVLSSCGVMP